MNWDKHQSKVTERQNHYLDYLIDLSFQGVIGFLLYHLKIMLLEQDTRYFLSRVEIKDYNVMIDGKHFFNQPVKNDLRT